jgi:hypothetical protein
VIWFFQSIIVVFCDINLHTPTVSDVGSHTKPMVLIKYGAAGFAAPFKEHLVLKQLLLWWLSARQTNINGGLAPMVRLMFKSLDQC